MRRQKQQVLVARTGPKPQGTNPKVLLEQNRVIEQGKEQRSVDNHQEEATHFQNY